MIQKSQLRTDAAFLHLLARSILQLNDVPGRSYLASLHTLSSAIKKPCTLYMLHFRLQGPRSPKPNKATFAIPVLRSAGQRPSSGGATTRRASSLQIVTPASRSRAWGFPAVGPCLQSASHSCQLCSCMFAQISPCAYDGAWELRASGVWTSKSIGLSFLGKTLCSETSHRHRRDAENATELQKLPAEDLQSPHTVTPHTNPGP